jgi:Na+/H+-dicarboxylate symporter
MLNKLIALGLLLGLVVGLGAAMTESALLQAIARESAPVGRIFINAIKMVVIPLVVVIIFSSVARLGDVRTLGKIGGTTLAFYWVTLVPAILIGMGVTAFGLRFVPDMATPPVDELPIPKLQSLTEFFVNLVPANPIAAAADGAILPLIIFTALFAAAAGTLPLERRERMIAGAEDVGDALIKLVWWILYLAPIGVFGLIAPATAAMGWGLIQSLGVFILSVAIALLLFVALIYVPLIAFRAKINPVRFFKAIVGAMSIAFSTTSTAAAIPVTREEVTKNLGVSETMADLLVPLGASLYRPGSALFQGAAIVFFGAYLRCPRGARNCWRGPTGDLLGVADNRARAVVQRGDHGACARCHWRARCGLGPHARHRPHSRYDAQRRQCGRSCHGGGHDRSTE